MKKKKDTDLFRGDSEERFNAFVALMALGRSDKDIRQYVSIDSHQLKRWRSEAYKDKFEAQLERHRANYASPTARQERLQQLQVDCGIRLLLEKKSVRFMRDLSLCLDVGVAHGNGERINWETLPDSLKEAIKAAAKKVGLCAGDFLNALIARLQAAERKERDDGHP